MSNDISNEIYNQLIVPVYDICSVCVKLPSGIKMHLYIQVLSYLIIYQIAVKWNRD